jgi:hypothetical protein
MTEAEAGFPHILAMPEPFRSHFPKTSEEAHGWEPSVMHTALHMNVLCVAKTRVEGTWAAYIANVPGWDHSREYEDVLRNGEKLPEHVARAIWGHFEPVPYAH